LEALSWHTTYVQHAHDLARVSAPNYGLFAAANGSNPKDDDHFVTQGAALEEESRIAHEALDRHGVDEAAVLSAASWLGASAERRRDAGHENGSRAYANLMREAVELLINLGYTLDRVKQDMQNGATLIDLFFPVWSKKAGEDLKRQILFCAKDLNSWSDPSIGVFDEARADEMIEWLEKKGLLAAHFSVAALIEVGHRPDRKANAEVIAHLVNLAAWLEHVCNALDPTIAALDNLGLKVPECWNGHPCYSNFKILLDQQYKSLKAYKKQNNHDFTKRSAFIMKNKPSNLLEKITQDAGLSQQIRNESMHEGLADLPRGEMQHAACIVLRTAMAMWLVRH
jgi:hypothetical protein